MFRLSRCRSLAPVLTRRVSYAGHRIPHQATRCIAASVSASQDFSSNSSFGFASCAGKRTLSTGTHQVVDNESGSSYAPRPFGKLMAANRGEIATRILRAGTELGCSTVGIYSHEDRFTQHRYKADQAFQLSSEKSPVAAYLDIDTIVDLCISNGVNAVHPGYGFLSENAQFAKKLEDAGVVFVGPTVDNLNTFGDKTSAKNLAIKTNVPVVVGSDAAFATPSEAEAWINEPSNPITYPVIVKAANGGGGRGIRVVPTPEDLEPMFRLASNEALSAFGDGRCFVEKYVEKPRHIEVQCLGDGTGNVIHLYDRDCSVQRRHQKVIETAPATGLSRETRQNIFNDAVRLLKANNYRNAGTVEFLVDKDGNHYFMEVNPRVQVEHTVTEEITGIDIVQSQIMIASGKTLPELGLTQDAIQEPTSYAMQCRVTTENPALDFRPDTGTIDVFRMPCGFGIRLDDGPGFQGAKITPHYDSLLVKITAKARNRKDAASKLIRALREFRVRGVQTNKSFLLNVLNNKDFLEGEVTTGFIADNPSLMSPLKERDRAQKLLHYIGEVIVNGTPKSLGATGDPPSSVNPIVPEIHIDHKEKKQSLKMIFDHQGPEAFAKAVREHEGLLITDTTWRDAHQSLLATRLRTIDMLNIAGPTSVALRNAYSLECWGGATFDVAMRFLNECPWDRLSLLREAVPDIPFQMLLRGANAVGYTSYPDNVVFEFCTLAKQAGMDVFRVFDSLNYIENMRLGIDAVGQAGGVVEAAVCYTGDVTDPKRGLYDLEYYLSFVRELEAIGIHVLAIKDMAGLLKPNACKMLVGAIREEFPNLPIHVHTHDTAGTGVASMLAAAEAGADAVDAATDALSGTTSQPSLGALVASTQGTKLDTGIELNQVSTLNEYWEECRGLYSPFESGQKSGSADVYIHEMPGGQYTNLLYQSSQLGLTGQWSQVKAAYATANRLLGDIIKVTPSSKVTGDLAQNWLVSLQARSLNGILADENNLMELWSLLHFLMPHVFRNRKDFAYWFSNPMDNIIEGNVKRNDDLINRLHGIIRPFVLRRLKKDVETQLPGKYEHIVKCQLSRRQMFLYEEFMSRSSTRKAMDGGNFMGMMNVLMQLRKVCNHPDLFEPRSVVTPFSMEPLSMSTATCVANAIDPKSGFERLSYFILLPLWCKGLGLPSLEGACSIDNVVAKQLAELMTPEAIIAEEARSRPSSEPVPRTGMESRLSLFLSNMCSLDQQDRLDRAYFISGVNSQRCQPAAFPYSDRLRYAVAVDSLPLDLPLFHEMTASQIAMTPTDLLAMKKSQEQRAEETSELIDKFVVCVPKAATSSKPVLFAGPSSSSSSLEKELLSKTSEALGKYFSIFKKADSRLTLSFPDKKLVQFDAGKLQTLANLLRDLKQGSHRVLIFTQMSKMLDVLEAFLNLNGHTYLRLDGATDVDKRQRLMDRFNNDTKIFCFILSTRSGGLGINLTGADTVIFYDSDWNPAMDAQAQDRAHRIGQTREVHIYRMVTEHSIEENILTKAKQKRNLDFLVMDEGKFHATSVVVSSEDMEHTDNDSGFTKVRLKNILGILSDEIDDVNTSEDEDLNEYQMQSAMNMLEDEDDVKAMHKAQKEAAEALEEFDESIQLKQDDEEGHETEYTNAYKLSKAKKAQSTKKAVESDLYAIDLDQSDKADESSKEDEDDKAMELEFITWQSKIGMDATQINDSLNPLERYGLKIKEVIDPYYSPYYFAEQERLLETAARSNAWDLDEIEQMKVEEERKAFDECDLLSTSPNPESLPRHRHLYQREKARLRSEIIKRKLTGQNWDIKEDEVSGKSFWHNVDTGEAVWEKPPVLKMLDQEATARSKGWSALPSKPLVNIMEFLLPYPDRTKCSTVCKSWKCAARDISFVLHVWPVEMGALVMDEKKLLKNHFRTISDAVKVALPGDSIELGDGHYWINDPGLDINVPIRFLGDEDDPSHVILELSGEIVWKANGGWMEGVTVRRPKLVTGDTHVYEVLRLDRGARLDIWHCVFDNRGCRGNCVSVAGSEGGGNWERVSIHGGSEGYSGLLIGKKARLQLIDCDISSNAGAGITRLK